MSCSTRPLVPDDLDFAHRLSRLAGWNQTRRDWERFLGLAPEGCLLAEWEGRPAGTATTTAYGSDLAWIGMVLVDPDFRRRGIGTALLKGTIHHLRTEMEIDCIRLDATPEGRPLYEGLGFVSEWDLRRWMRAGRTTAAFSGCTPLDQRGIAISLSSPSFSLDRDVFGANRSRLLASLAAGSIAAETREDGSFGLLREGERARYLGPITASSPAAGLRMAEALVVRSGADHPIFWDLPDDNTAATDLARHLGFQPVRTLTRMRLGDPNTSADPLRIFALAEPALG